jgi:hypothetical protein
MCQVCCVCNFIVILFHFTGGKLRGQKKEDESDVLCWMNAAETLYRPAIMAWVLPATSCMMLEKQVCYLFLQRAFAFTYFHFSHSMQRALIANVYLTF